MKPLLCFLAHRYRAHAYRGEGMLFCTRCGEMVALGAPEPEEDEKESKKGKR